MIRKEFFLTGFLLLLILIAGCAQPAVDGGNTIDTFVLESALQVGGVSDSVDTTRLRLYFNGDPTNLRVNDVHVIGATKGSLSGTGNTRDLTISNISVRNSESITVFVTSPVGMSISGSPKSVVVYRSYSTDPTAISVNFEGVVQSGGTSGTTDSAQLSLSFNIDPTTLNAGYITLTGATKGALSGSGTTRTLTISDITVSDSETLSVSISNPPGYTITGSTKTAIVYKGLSSSTATPVTLESVSQIGGVSGSLSTTALTLTFDTDPTTLNAGYITLTGATKGALSGTGTTRTLIISDITVADSETVSVSINNPPGFSISGSSMNAVVYRGSSVQAPTEVTFVSVEQTGGSSDISDSTGLVLTFDQDPTTLTLENINILGATKWALSGTGLTRTLSISDISVFNNESVSVSVSSPSGYSISGSPKTAVVYKDLIDVRLLSLDQIGGVSASVDSTGLLLTFDGDPATLTAADIELTGATKGILSGSGNTRTLAISDITVTNGENASINITYPVGYRIFNTYEPAAVYRSPHIGMPYQGGTIAYITQPGEAGYVSGEDHGLIVADSKSQVADWIEGSNSIHLTLNGDTEMSYGSGQENTTAMMNQTDFTGGAAKKCDDYYNTEDGTGVFYDWYLPSIDELHKIFLNREVIGGFNTVYYWSSTEQNSYRAYHIYFGGTGGIQFDNKSSSYSVCPVRSF